MGMVEVHTEQGSPPSAPAGAMRGCPFLSEVLSPGLVQEWVRRMAFGLLLACALAAVGLPPAVLQAQQCDETGILASSGPSFPAHLEKLHGAYVGYLSAWNGESPDSVLSFLAPEAHALVRSRILGPEGLENLIEMAVPNIGFQACSVFLVEDRNGWVNVGTYVQVSPPVAEDHEALAGSMLTVWEHGPDLQWRVVFLTALWLELEEIPTFEVVTETVGF